MAAISAGGAAGALGSQARALASAASSTPKRQIKSPASWLFTWSRNVQPSIPAL